MIISYLVKLEPDDGALLVTCPELPEVTTFGEDEDDAIAHARNAIEEALAARIADGRDIPRPRATGRHRAAVSLQAQMKVQLYWALAAAEITRAELMRRLGWKRESVDRLFRLDHATRIDQYDAAFRALGREIEFAVHPQRLRSEPQLTADTLAWERAQRFPVEGKAKRPRRA
jgi:antitoxin HicB